MVEYQLSAVRSKQSSRALTAMKTTTINTTAAPTATLYTQQTAFLLEKKDIVELRAMGGSNETNNKVKHFTNMNVKKKRSELCWMLIFAEMFGEWNFVCLLC